MNRIAPLILLIVAIGASWNGGARVHAAQPSPRPCVSRSGKAPKVLFRDDGAGRPDFNEFRRRLRDATSRRDIAAVTAILHPQIQVDFGGSSGPDAFKETHVNNPDEDFWTEFADILAMGGRFDGPDIFAAPYAFTEFPENVDSFECLVVVGNDIRVRERPSADARVLARLDRDVVQASSDDNPVPGWRRVETADGVIGFVASRYLRSPIDHRAIFGFRGGRWLLMVYVAGD
jgi:hypothetical protein